MARLFFFVFFVVISGSSMATAPPRSPRIARIIAGSVVSPNVRKLRVLESRIDRPSTPSLSAWARATSVNQTQQSPKPATTTTICRIRKGVKPGLKKGDTA